MPQQQAVVSSVASCSYFIVTFLAGLAEVESWVDLPSSAIMLGMSEEAASHEDKTTNGTGNYWEKKEITQEAPITQTTSSNPMLTRIGGLSAWLIGVGALVLFVAISERSVLWSTIGGSAVGCGVSLAISWMCISAIVHEIRKLKSSD